VYGARQLISAQHGHQITQCSIIRLFIAGK